MRPLLSYCCCILVGKDRPLTLRILLLQQEMPRLVFGNPCEGVVKGPVGVFEDKLDAVTGAQAVAERLRESPTEDINPMNHVPVAGIVVSDVDVGFISRLAADCRGVLFIKEKKLVIEDPLCGEIHLPLPADNDTTDLPAAGEVIKQIVMKRPVNAIERLGLSLWQR